MLQPLTGPRKLTSPTCSGEGIRKILVSITTDKGLVAYFDHKKMKAHLSQEDGSRGGSKTKPKALTDPQGDQKGKVRGKVEGNEAKAGYRVAEQEHPLPPQYLAGRDACQHAQGHAHLVLVVQLDSSDTYNIAIC